MEDGYELWLRYRLVQSASRKQEYGDAFRRILVEGESGSLEAAREELKRGLGGILGHSPELVREGPGALGGDGVIVMGTPATSRVIESLDLAGELSSLGEEGYWIGFRTYGAAEVLVLAANTDIGVLYGAFALLRHLQTERPLREWAASQGTGHGDCPRFRHRMLDHWDNLDGTIERGYAGFSIWDWHKLPAYVSPRYKDYARACASIGLNGAALTNVNANALVLTPAYLEKAAALADVFRPYGVRVFLTARFSAPVEIGGLATADPLDDGVASWWKQKVAEVYEYIPDFGGFLVKANSEGQPGPQDYGRSHADGANILADALAPYGGIVIWRAFVYDHEVPEDRAKQAYEELVPLDGRFRENVCLQAKNGPIDFQPREPFHPLFGGLEKTPLFAEFQLTQEYLGFATHLAYLAPLIKETLDADTHARGPGSTVTRVLDGSLYGQTLTGIAAVANTGSDRNWCGHPFAAANWFALGRLAWDPQLSSEEIAEEWLRMTFSNDSDFLGPATAMMMRSREAVVDYMTPLGLHHQMAWDHHYGPGPWISEGRSDWTSVYYHRADAHGIGFDRTSTGSKAIALYHPPVAEKFGELASCPEAYLLWFHHVPWAHPMQSGRTLWEELCFRYAAGVRAVREMQGTWEGLRPYVDEERFAHVRALLAVQEKEARWWRDASVLYFQTFSQKPLPMGYEQPEHTLEYFMQKRHHYVPGI